MYLVEVRIPTSSRTSLRGEERVSWDPVRTFCGISKSRKGKSPRTDVPPQNILILLISNKNVKPSWSMSLS